MNLSQQSFPWKGTTEYLVDTWPIVFLAFHQHLHDHGIHGQLAQKKTFPVLRSSGHSDLWFYLIELANWIDRSGFWKEQTHAKKKFISAAQSLRLRIIQYQWWPWPISLLESGGSMARPQDTSFRPQMSPNSTEYLPLKASYWFCGHFIWGQRFTSARKVHYKWTIKLGSEEDGGHLFVNEV